MSELEEAQSERDQYYSDVQYWRERAIAAERERVPKHKFEALVRQCELTEAARDDAWCRLKQLNEGDTSGAWCWMGDGNDHLESLTVPVLIPAAELRAIVDERDALAAHVSCMTRIAYEVCNDAWDSSMGGDVIYRAMMNSTGDIGRYPDPIRMLAEAALDSPENSLAKLKAEWQAEKLEELASESFVYDEQELRDHAAELRRQAEDQQP